MHARERACVCVPQRNALSSWQKAVGVTHFMCHRDALIWTLDTLSHKSVDIVEIAGITHCISSYHYFVCHFIVPICFAAPHFHISNLFNLSFIWYSFHSDALCKWFDSNRIHSICVDCIPCDLNFVGRSFVIFSIEWLATEWWINGIW